MSGVVMALGAFVGGDLGGKLLLWLAGKFGGRILGRIGDAIEKRRGTMEDRGDGKQA